MMIIVLRKVMIMGIIEPELCDDYCTKKNKDHGNY